MRETAAAIQAWNDYRSMEGRSLEKLQRLYASRAQTASPLSPTKRLATLKLWCAAFHWQERLAEEERQRLREQDEYQSRERRKVFAETLSLDYERVRALRSMAAKLLESTLALKLSEAPASRINVLYTQLRGVLDDIAREVGGRQPAPTVRFMLLDYARNHAVEWGMSEADAVTEAERLLAEGQ